eukprot:967044-Amphidinium_carterae.2
MWFRTWIKTQCECNVGEVIGLGQECVRERHFLKRSFCEDGWHHGADANHIEGLLVRAGLTEAKGMKIPECSTDYVELLYRRTRGERGQA